MPRRPPAVARVLERVTKTAREHEMFRPGDLVLVSCSGGPDSVCLLYSMWHLRRLFKIRLAVFHFDHKLRPDSAKDAVYVMNLAKRLKLPFHLRVAEDSPSKGESLEAWARVRRIRGWMDVSWELGAGEQVKVAFGHTLDDQAETILMRMLTGGGAAGVSGIKPRVGPMVHPMLSVSREEVEAFCRSIRLRPRSDLSNADPEFGLRNAIRLKGMPALEQAVGRNVKGALARSAGLLSADDDELVEQMFAVWDELVTESELGVQIQARRVSELPRVISARLISQAIFRCGSPSTKADVDAILDLAEGRPGRRRDLFHGLKAVREKEYVRVSRPASSSLGPPSPES